MDPEELLIEQKKLQDEAFRVLRDLGLIEKLKKYGLPQIIGSVSLGLMTWRDIDIEVVVKTLQRSFVVEIIAYLIEKVKNRVDLVFIDNSLCGRQRMPKGIYLGVKYFPDDLSPEETKSTSDKLWKIDIWFVTEGSVRTKQIQQKLTEEYKKTILGIKNILSRSPKYRKEIFSVDIYEAVLEKGVKNIEEFRTYLQSTGRDTE